MALSDAEDDQFELLQEPSSRRSGSQDTVLEHDAALTTADIQSFFQQDMCTDDWHFDEPTGNAGNILMSTQKASVEPTPSALAVLEETAMMNDHDWSPDSTPRMTAERPVHLSPHILPPLLFVDHLVGQTGCPELAEEPLLDVDTGDDTHIDLDSDVEADPCYSDPDSDILCDFERATPLIGDPHSASPWPTYFFKSMDTDLPSAHINDVGHGDSKLFISERPTNWNPQYEDGVLEFADEESFGFFDL